jgi:hypothetical protein
VFERPLLAESGRVELFGIFTNITNAKQARLIVSMLQEWTKE